MSRFRMQGFAGGIVFTCAVIAFFYYTFFNDDTITAKNTVVTEADVQQYLENEGLTAISKEKYQAYIADQEDKKEQDQNKKDASKGEKDENKQSNESTDKQNQDQQSVHTAKITVESGMSTQAIVSQMVENNLLDNGDAFIDYLKENDLARLVQIGSYKLSSDMTLAEMAEAITR